MIGAISLGAIVGESPIEKGREPLPCSGLTRLPGLCHRGGPAACRQQLEGVDRQTLHPGHHRSGPELLGGVRRFSRLVPGQQRSPEGGEDLIRPSLLGGHVHRLMEQPAVEALGPEAVGGEGLLDRRVSCDDRRLVTPVPDDVGGPGLLGHRAKRSERWSAANHQRRPRLRQGSRQPFERVMEPPPRRGPGLPGSLLLRRVNEDGHHRTTCGGGRQSRIIVEPEILPKPDDRHGGGGHGSNSWFTDLADDTGGS